MSAGALEGAAVDAGAAELPLDCVDRAACPLLVPAPLDPVVVLRLVTVDHPPPRPDDHTPELVKDAAADGGAPAVDVVVAPSLRLVGPEPDVRLLPDCVDDEKTPTARDDEAACDAVDAVLDTALAEPLPPLPPMLAAVTIAGDVVAHAACCDVADGEIGV